MPRLGPRLVQNRPLAGPRLDSPLFFLVLRLQFGLGLMWCVDVQDIFWFVSLWLVYTRTTCQMTCEQITIRKAAKWQLQLASSWPSPHQAKLNVALAESDLKLAWGKDPLVRLGPGRISRKGCTWPRLGEALKTRPVQCSRHNILWHVRMKLTTIGKWRSLRMVQTK